jgi:hypothetical protein
MDLIHLPVQRAHPDDDDADAEEELAKGGPRQHRQGTAPVHPLLTGVGCWVTEPRLGSGGYAVPKYRVVELRIGPPTPPAAAPPAPRL